MLSALNHIGTPECRRWSRAIFQQHATADKILMSHYIRQARTHGYRAANEDLREINQALTFGENVSATMDDGELCHYAKEAAESCEAVLHEMGTYSDIDGLKAMLEYYCENFGASFPLALSKNDTEEEIHQKILAAARRVADERWWRRQLRKNTARQTEGLFQRIGLIRKGKAPYVSNWAYARWKISRTRNANALASMEAVTTDNGEEKTVDLSECIAKSVSNPENMRNELMVRMRGYEEIAVGLRLVGVFFTLTAPSKYHAQRASGGANPNYEGATPRDTMAYLNNTWAKIRAEWARQDIRVFGFRVAEPHHDGTPHFHLLLFIDQQDQKNAIQIFGEYALAEDGYEAGAQEQRWDVTTMDPGKGSAAGYIAKYVAKNLDGYAVGNDEEGQCFAEEGAARTRAWSSIWGIRQFQQIGSVSVSVWRELRKKREAYGEFAPEELEALRQAADDSDWARFVVLMGGPMVCRTHQALEMVRHDTDCINSRYGEAVERVVGFWLKIVSKGIKRFIPLEKPVWTIRKKEGCYSAPKVKTLGPPLRSTVSVSSGPLSPDFIYAKGDDDLTIKGSDIMAAEAAREEAAFSRAALKMELGVFGFSHVAKPRVLDLCQ